MSTSASSVEMTTYGQLPAVRIRSTDGAQAIVTLYGAHLVSWQGADGVERLFCSAASTLDGSRAIRGGVPVIFPQFAERGAGMRHGFARVATWRLHERGAGFAVFALENGDLPAALAQGWPHGFALSLRVEVNGGMLALAFEVTNTGGDAFAFSAALHTYFAVADLARVRIGGVQEGEQQAELRIDDKFDHIFQGIGGDMTLADGDATLRLAQSGFCDAVVWNPGAVDAAALNDMEDAEYRRFVCIEPALIEPLTLAPGATWRGAHTVAVAG